MSGYENVSYSIDTYRHNGEHGKKSDNPVGCRIHHPCLEERNGTRLLKYSESEKTGE